jgi:hypothetical protein
VKLKIARGKAATALLAAIPDKGLKAGLTGQGLAPRAVLLKGRLSRGA